MSMAESYISIMESSLDKKIEILDRLIEANAVQRTIIETEEFDDEAFDSNVNYKSSLIDKLTELDNGFQMLYDNVKKELDLGRYRYAEEIKRLQEKIRIITEKSSKIQVAENENKLLIENKFTNLKKQVTVAKRNQQVASSYYNTMNKITSEPVLFESKK